MFSLFSEESELVVEKGLPEKEFMTQNQNNFVKIAVKQILAEEPDSAENGIEYEELPTVNQNSLLKPENSLTKESNIGQESAEASGERGGDIKKYIIKGGDTPASIAARFGIKITTLLWANNLPEGDYIKPGNILVILPTDGVLHKVRAGETTGEIAKKYNADQEKIISFNNLDEEGSLKTGEEIIVPGGSVSLSERPRERLKEIGEQKEETISPNIPLSPEDFVWPTTTRRISQYFRWGHKGIDIPNNYQPIFAAAGGYVESTGWFGGYGLMMTINHGNGVKTLYAHTSKIFVKRGERVKRGQKIGQVGNTGRSTGPHLHFEISVNGVKKNPLAYY